MNKTKILYNEEARSALLAGITKVSNAVITTLGPKGQNVALSTRYGAPSIVHDGVSVASRIFLEDPTEDEGAKLIKEAAQRTNQETGDGTTTSTLLTSEMVSLGMKFLTSGANGMTIRNGMEKALNMVTESVEADVADIKQDEWKDIATISAQDEEIGQKIADAFELVGTDGSIQVEEGAKDRIEIEHKEGLSFEEGFMSEYFITDYARMNTVYEDANVIVTDVNISSISQFKAIAKAWNKVGESNKPVIIVCGGMSNDLLAVAVANKMKAAFPIVVVKAPEQGDKRSQMLNDIALFTGSTFISSEAGMKLNDITHDDLGTAKKVVVDRYSTTLMADPDKEMIQARIDEIKSQIKHEDNEFNVEFAKRRIAKLTNGIAIIYVGGRTESETKELRERVYDAVGATRSAIEEGIVLGGGISLYNASEDVENSKEYQDMLLDKSIDQDFIFGMGIVLSSVKKSLIRLIDNSGDNSGRIIEQIKAKNKEEKTTDYGYNAYTGKVENLREKSIIDPFKVIRVALANAVSVAGSVLTTSCLVVEIPEKEE